MGFQIIFAPQAINRLSAIVRYIASDNPDAAERFGMKLVEQTAILADFQIQRNLTAKEKTFAAYGADRISFTIGSTIVMGH